MKSFQTIIGKSYVSKFKNNGIRSFDDLYKLYDNEQEFYDFLQRIENNDLKRVELNIRIELAMSEFISKSADKESSSSATESFVNEDVNDPKEKKKPFYKKVWFWGVMLVVLYYGVKLILLNIENRKYYEENRKRAAEWEAAVEKNKLENQKPKQSEKDLNLQKKLVGEWKCEKVINSMLSKRERRDISRIQLLFSEEFYRTKQGYSDYADVQPYYIKDGKLYESKSYSSFDSIWFNNDRSMSMTISKSGYGTIELQFKKIK